MTVPAAWARGLPQWRRAGTKEAASGENKVGPLRPDLYATHGLGVRAVLPPAWWGQYRLSWDRWRWAETRLSGEVRVQMLDSICSMRRAMASG